jgi:transposase-like protein
VCFDCPLRTRLLLFLRFHYISGAGPSAVTRWKKQYLAEINGQTPKSSKAMTPEQQEIQSLKKQLWRAKRDNYKSMFCVVFKG